VNSSHSKPIIKAGCKWINSAIAVASWKSLCMDFVDRLLSRVSILRTSTTLPQIQLMTQMARLTLRSPAAW
jgi:hypothetical protein